MTSDRLGKESSPWGWDHTYNCLLLGSWGFPPWWPSVPACGSYSTLVVPTKSDWRQISIFTILFGSLSTDHPTGSINYWLTQSFCINRVKWLKVISIHLTLRIMGGWFRVAHCPGLSWGFSIGFEAWGALEGALKEEVIFSSDYLKIINWKGRC